MIHKKSNLLFLIPVLLLAVITLLIVQGPDMNLFVDQRFRQIEVGDYVQVRSSSSGKWLEVFSARASSHYSPQMMVFLKTLPTVSETSSGWITIAHAESQESQELASAEVYKLDYYTSLRLTKTLEQFQHQTIEEIDFQRFGPADRSLVSGTIAAVIDSEQAITPKVLDNRTGKTFREFHDGYDDFRQRVAKEYSASTNDPDPIRTRCIRFLELYLENRMSEPNQQTTKQLKISRQLRTESQDPIVLLHCGMTERDYGNNEEGQTTVASIAENIDATRCPFTRLLARAAHLGTFSTYPFSRLKRGHRQAMEAFVQDAARSVSCVDPESKEFAYVAFLYHASWLRLDTESQKQLLRNLAQNRETPDWLLHNFLAHYYSAEAWRERGTSIYWNMPEERKTAFSRLLRCTTYHALRAHALRPDIHYPSIILARAARSGGTNVGSSRAWFLAGLQANIEDRELYLEYTRSLRPEWGGSNQLILDFATSLSQSNRFDTFLPYATFDVLAQLAIPKDRRPRLAAWKVSDVRPIMVDFRRRLPLNSSDPETRRRTDDAFMRCAAVALVGDDQPEAEAALASTSAAESEWFEFYELEGATALRRRIARKSLLQKTQLVGFRQTKADGYGFESSTDFKKVQSQLQQLSNDHAKTEFRDVAQQLSMVCLAFERFHAGDVVRIPFDEKEYLWQRLTTGVSFDGDCLVRIGRNFRTDVVALMTPRFPLPFELSFTVTVDPEAPYGKSLPIFLSDESVASATAAGPGHCFFLDVNSDSMVATSPEYSGESLGKPPIHDRNDITLRIFKDRVETSVNGVETSAVKRSFSGGPVVGVAATSADLFDCSMDNVTVRRINQDQAASEEKHGAP